MARVVVWVVEVDAVLWDGTPARPWGSYLGAGLGLAARDQAPAPPAARAPQGPRAPQAGPTQVRRPAVTPWSRLAAAMAALGPASARALAEATGLRGQLVHNLLTYRLTTGAVVIAGHGPAPPGGGLPAVRLYALPQEPHGQAAT